MTLKQFVKELNGNRVEGELIKTVFYSLITSFIFLAVLYSLKLQYVEDFLSKKAFHLFFAALSYALIVPAMKHVRAYKELPCMSGMMVGMTVGAIAGFLSAFHVTATNGMFVGSVFGMAVGIAFGTLTGKCCGIMGFMEGIMAGFMGGLMGAMAAFMLLNDNIKLASVITLIISAVIIFGLHYMLYKDTKENERGLYEGNFVTFLTTLILIAVTTGIIVFGPRSAIFGG